VCRYSAPKDCSSHLGKGGKHRGQFGEPVSLAVDGLEFVYVVDAETTSLKIRQQRHSRLGNGQNWQAGRRIQRSFRPSSLSGRRSFVLDAGNARVQMFDNRWKVSEKFGSEGKWPGEFPVTSGAGHGGGCQALCWRPGQRKGAGLFRSAILQRASGPCGAGKGERIQLTWKANAETFLEHYKYTAPTHHH